MNIREVKELFERIKRHYNVFTYDDGKIQEWYKFLKDYSSEDVNKRFDEYLSYGYDQPPYCMSLTKNIEKIKRNNEDDSWITECDICKKRITIYNNDMTDYEIHRRKCSKIDFIDRMSKKYKEKGITWRTYYDMSDTDLDIEYHRAMNFWLQNKEDKNVG